MELFTNNIGSFLFTLLLSLPIIILLSVGLILSFIYRKRMGKAWIYSALGFVFLLLTSVISLIYNLSFHYLLSAVQTETYSIISMVYNIFTLLLRFIGYLLLLAAMFIKRPDNEILEPAVKH